MNVKIVFPIVVLVVTVGGIFFFLSPGSKHQLSSSAPAASPSGLGQNSPSPASSNTQRTNKGAKFADTPLSKYAYLVSGDTLDASATRALSGFQLTKDTLPDGSKKITLQAKKSEYHTQTYALKPGEQLYFIETSFGDDASDEDYNLSDDTAVVVDANGYAVQ